MRSEHEIPVPGGGLLQDLVLYAYPDFGVFVYRTKRMFLAIRCGSIGQDGVGGHAHNDQLSIELNVDGEDWIADPGTYLYTPIPELRDEYRSVRAHFAPRMGGREPGRMDPGLFRLGDEAEGKCVYFHEDGFIGSALGIWNSGISFRRGSGSCHFCHRCIHRCGSRCRPGYRARRLPGKFTVFLPRLRLAMAEKSLNLLIVTNIYAPLVNPRAFRWASIAEHWIRKGTLSTWCAHGGTGCRKWN